MDKAEQSKVSNPEMLWTTLVEMPAVTEATRHSKDKLIAALGKEREHNEKIYWIDVLKLIGLRGTVALLDNSRSLKLRDLFYVDRLKTGKYSLLETMKALGVDSNDLVNVLYEACLLFESRVHGKQIDTELKVLCQRTENLIRNGAAKGYAGWALYYATKNYALGCADPRKIYRFDLEDSSVFHSSGAFTLVYKACEDLFESFHVRSCRKLYESRPSPTGLFAGFKKSIQEAEALEACNKASNEARGLYRQATEVGLSALLERLS